MSRLTAKTELDYFKKVYVSEDELVQSLGRYEDMGEPEELVKVVRCGECVEYEPHDSEGGICENFDRVVYVTEYCSCGQAKEAQS